MLYYGVFQCCICVEKTAQASFVKFFEKVMSNLVISDHFGRLCTKRLKQGEPNKLTIYAKLCQNVTTFYQQESAGIEKKTFQVNILLLMLMSFCMLVYRIY